MISKYICNLDHKWNQPRFRTRRIVTGALWQRKPQPKTLGPPGLSAYREDELLYELYSNIGIVEQICEINIPYKYCKNRKWTQRGYARPWPGNAERLCFLWGQENAGMQRERPAFSNAIRAAQSQNRDSLRTLAPGSTSWGQSPKNVFLLENVDYAGQNPVFGGWVTVENACQDSLSGPSENREKFLLTLGVKWGILSLTWWRDRYFLGCGWRIG